MKRTPFKSKSGGFKPKAGIKPGQPKARPNPAVPQPARDAREAVKRQAINALKRAKHAAEKAGVELSEWEGEFLGSVAERISKYGRAFADPDKGAMNAPMSAMQGRKLREITAKIKGEPRFPPKGPRGRRNLNRDDPESV